MVLGSRHLAACGLATTMLFGGRAWADEPSGREDAGKAMAEQLFQEGRALMDQGRAAEACPKFAESARLDVAPGTLFNLAECYEATGRFASAWVRYHEMQVVASRLGQVRRAEHAASKIAELEPRLSYLIIEVPSASPGMVVRQDGLDLGKAAWGTRLPVDTGAHEVSAEAPGTIPWHVRVEVKRREVRVRVPELRPSTEAPGSAPPSGGRSILVPVGIGLLVTSGVAAVGAIAFGVAAKVENDTARREECGPASCRQAGLDRLDRAITYGNVATGFVIGAAVTLASGIVALLLAPSRPHKAEAFATIRF